MAIGAVSVVAMLTVVASFGTSRRASLEALLIAGVVGVAVFGALLGAVRLLTKRLVSETA